MLVVTSLIRKLLVDNELAWIAGLRGDFRGMRASAQRVVETAESLDHRFALIQGLTAMAQASFFQGRFAETEPEHRRALAIARREGKSYRAVISLTTLACSLAAEGRVEEALALVQEAKAESPAWRESLLPEWEAMVRRLLNPSGTSNTGLCVYAITGRRMLAAMSKSMSWG